MSISRLTSPAAAAGSAEPAGAPRAKNVQDLPKELLDLMSTWAKNPSVAAVSLRMLEVTELNRNDKWAEIYPQLRNDPLIASYIASLGLDNPRLIGREKFQRLFEAMTAELGIPESIRGVDRFSADCYLSLSNAANVSLERAWGRRMRDALRNVGPAGLALPGLDARAAQIRAWLNDPVNRAVLGAVQELDLSICGLHLIPSEIRKFPNLVTLDLSGNRIKVIGSRQFEGLANLETLYLHQNRLESLPAGLFRGLGSLQQLSLEGNELKSLPEGLFQGLANLNTLYLRQNQLESLPAGLFRGLGSLQRLFLNHNHLESLPASLFRGLLNLQALFLDHNRLENLPEGLFQDLIQCNWLVLWRNSSDFRHFGNGFLDLSAQEEIAAMSKYYRNQYPRDMVFQHRRYIFLAVAVIGLASVVEYLRRRLA